MIPKSPYVMDYIKDKDVYKAVMFASKLCREGVAYHDAVRRAAYYYRVDMDEVRHYMSQRSGRSQKRKTKQGGKTQCLKSK